MSRILYRSNKQTLQKFESFSTSMSQEDILENTRLWFGVLKSKNQRFVKSKVEDFRTEHKVLKQSIKRKKMKKKKDKGEIL